MRRFLFFIVIIMSTLLTCSSFHYIIKVPPTYRTRLNVNQFIEENSVYISKYSEYIGSEKIVKEIIEEAIRQDVPVDLALGVVKKESGFKIRAKNLNIKNGVVVSIDRGLFQLNDKTFPKLTEEDFFNYKINIHYGIRHLKWCLDNFGANAYYALLAYNAGKNFADNDYQTEKTNDYVSDVLINEREYDELINGAI